MCAILPVYRGQTKINESIFLSKKLDPEGFSICDKAITYFHKEYNAMILQVVDSEPTMASQLSDGRVHEWNTLRLR
ncbi:hypothetical protein V6N12_042527 [Hibiscus sabdariffa]|uniref:Uncharacterized protein n=1 Tax=Hibiscus sabdariffa TaxID=183260 RepID=A0ABR2EF17_9ROSI